MPENKKREQPHFFNNTTLTEEEIKEMSIGRQMATLIGGACPYKPKREKDER
jgi:hypothetical protein